MVDRIPRLYKTMVDGVLSLYKLWLTTRTLQTMVDGVLKIYKTMFDRVLRLIRPRLTDY